MYEVLSPSSDCVVYSNDLLISKNHNVTSIRLPPTPHLEAWASQPNCSGSSCASCRIGNSCSRWPKPILERFVSTRSWVLRSNNAKRNGPSGSRTRRVESLLCVNRYLLKRPRVNTLPHMLQNSLHPFLYKESAVEHGCQHGSENRDETIERDSSVDIRCVFRVVRTDKH